MKLLWILTLLSSLLGGLVILGTMMLAKGAPQEAAGYAMACALAVVPYVFSRAAQAYEEGSQLKNINRVIKAIEALQVTKQDSNNA